MRAEKLQKRAATVGFDWSDRADVLAKIREEIDELAAAGASGDKDAVEDEVGDLMFAVCNLARHLGVDAETALRRTNDKFVRRFRFIEQHVADANESLSEASLDRMEALWQSAKRIERRDR
jgi:ATP diphosphatase